MEIAAKVSYFILNSPVRSTKKQMECLNSARVFCSSPFSRWITSRSSSSKLFIGGLFSVSLPFSPSRENVGAARFCYSAVHSRIFNFLAIC